MDRGFVGLGDMYKADNSRIDKPITAAESHGRHGLCRGIIIKARLFVQRRMELMPCWLLSGELLSR